MALVGLAAAVGCAAASSAPEPVRKARARSPAQQMLPSELTDAGWVSVESRRQSLVLALPMREAWRIDDAREPWFLARHAATGSELRLRTWPAPRQVRADECQAQARLWRPSIPPIRDEAVVTRKLSAPEAFAGEIIVGVEPGGDGLEGHVLAFGATVGRCYAAIFTTRASGPGSEDTLGRRLVLIVEAVLPRVRLLGVEDRVKAAREHPPTGPPSP
jgi:hypothetical protein